MHKNQTQKGDLRRTTSHLKTTCSMATISPWPLLTSHLDSPLSFSSCRSRSLSSPLSIPSAEFSSLKIFSNIISAETRFTRARLDDEAMFNGESEISNQMLCSIFKCRSPTSLHDSFNMSTSYRPNMERVGSNAILFRKWWVEFHP